jgi:DNA (cytosine-5)-methyltransferase 1
MLDLFSGAGGCARGYQDAGFYVIGVDRHPMPNYAGDEFVQADALSVLELLIGDLRGNVRGSAWRLRDFDAIHASPPCQAYSPLNAYNRKEYPDLVGPVRELLKAAGLPYVIENVPQAPLDDPITLCGHMFGLRLYRHRGFETSFPITQPPHLRHVAKCARNGYFPDDDQFMSIHGGKHSKAWQKKAAEEMGVPWMKSIVEVCEAIPPAFTRCVGEQLADHLLNQSPQNERKELA